MRVETEEEKEISRENENRGGRELGDVLKCGR